MTDEGTKKLKAKIDELEEEAKQARLAAEAEA